MTKMSLLTGTSETSFQSFVLVISRWEMEADQDAHLVEYNLLTWLQDIPKFRHLKKIEKVNKLDVWFPHIHSQKN